MINTLFFCIAAIVFGYFATQNTQSVSVKLAEYVLTDIPLYLLLGVSILLGFFLSWFFSLSRTFSWARKVRGKEHIIKDTKKTVHELTKQVNQLELENAELRGKLDSADTHV